jgi:hypothetical protein
VEMDIEALNFKFDSDFGDLYFQIESNKSNSHFALRVKNPKFSSKLAECLVEKESPVNNQLSTVQHLEREEEERREFEGFDDEEEEEEEIEFMKGDQSESNYKNSLLADSYKHERTFVVRGPNIGIFKRGMNQNTPNKPMIQYSLQ